MGVLRVSTIMAPRNYDVALSVIGLCFCFVFTNAFDECFLKTCPGPLNYYKELGCRPIFDDVNACCPARYNCDVWETLPLNKCLVNGHVYELLATLRLEDKLSACGLCNCGGDRFYCASPSCESVDIPEGCHVVSLSGCCEHFVVCDDTPSACYVDGKWYKIGERFTPRKEPLKECYCAEGYDGINDKRFCTKREPFQCGNVINNIGDIRNHCAPVYKKDKLLNVDCNQSMRCQKPEDYLIHDAVDTIYPLTLKEKRPEDRCKFGHLEMSIGDRLNDSEDWQGTISCICEVPPVPTCHYSNYTFVAPVY